jgi:hypothetical protein
LWGTINDSPEKRLVGLTHKETGSDDVSKPVGTPHCELTPVAPVRV